MDWEKWLLQYTKDIIIIVLVVLLVILWTKVPEYKLTDSEDNHASEQSK